MKFLGKGGKKIKTKTKVYSQLVMWLLKFFLPFYISICRNGALNASGLAPYSLFM